MEKYSKLFIQDNVVENVVCEMASIFSRRQCGNDNYQPFNSPANEAVTAGGNQIQTITFIRIYSLC